MIWSAIVLGFMGSLHCLAMCGPLVLALNARKRQSFSDRVLYNTGRIFTYSVLGVLAGIFGSGIQWAVGQQFLSVFTGVLLLLGLMVSWLSANRKYRIGNKATAALKMRLTAMLNGPVRNMWWFGVFNGLLPCGLTYVALAAAVSLGNVWEAVIYMALFGLGTGPMMWGIVSIYQRFKFKSLSSNRLITGFTWLLAILLIVRGMGLGVPYLSPDANTPHNHESHINHMN